MRVQAADLDQDGDIDLVAGAKDSSDNGSDLPAGIWWYENPHDTNGWTPDQSLNRLESPPDRRRQVRVPK